MDKMKIGYVCTNYNNSHYTEIAVASFVRACPQGCRVVVVDNCSDAQNVALLRQIKTRFECVDLILNRENLGYFRGLNVGIHHLRGLDASLSYIVVGNNDLTFPENFGALVAARQGVLGRHAVVSPDVLTLDGLHQNPHVITGISKLRELSYDIYHSSYCAAKILLLVARILGRIVQRGDERQWMKSMHIAQGHGSCYILGPEFFKNFHELWAPTFLFGEEFFLSKQLADRGFSVFYDPTISVVHHCHGAVAKAPAKKMWEYSCMAHRVYRRYVKFFG